MMEKHHSIALFCCYSVQIILLSNSVVSLGLLVILTKSVFFGFLFFKLRQVSLCCPGCPRTPYVDEAGLELSEILLPLSCLCLLSIGIKGMLHRAWLKSGFVLFLSTNEHYGNGMWGGVPQYSWKAYCPVSEVYSCIPMVEPLPFYLVNGVGKKCGSVVSSNSIPCTRNVERFGEWNLSQLRMVASFMWSVTSFSLKCNKYYLAS